MFSADELDDLTVEELKQQLDRGQSLCLLDVRQPEEYQICRLPGSTLIPLRDLPSRWPELDLEQTIVVYCHHGIRSARAVQFLRQVGFLDVRNLRGGIDAWSRRVDPSVPTY